MSPVTNIECLKDNLGYDSVTALTESEVFNTVNAAQFAANQIEDWCDREDITLTEEVLGIECI